MAGCMCTQVCVFGSTLVPVCSVKGKMWVGCLLNVPATCQCISGMDLLNVPATGQCISGTICLTSQQHASVSQGWICLTSQQHAIVSQGRICSDNCMCCLTETEVADHTFHLTQSQYTDTRSTSPSMDPITPGAWQGSH